jgi:hypothetical protein
MTPDRNKTLGTRKITASVMVWMDNLGFKPVETEVQLCAGWQCDIAGVIDPTRSEAVAMKLIPRNANWKDWQKDSVAADEKARAHESAYAALPSPITTLVEVKATLSDLKGDRKWEGSSPADLSFLAVPEKLVAAAVSLVTNPHWGLIRVTERGCRVIRWPVISSVTIEQRLATVYSIAVKRDHRTRYRALRESEKQARATKNKEKVTPDRWSEIARVVTIIAPGGRAGVFAYESVQHVLSSKRIGWLPVSVVEQLQELWGIAAIGEGPNAMSGQATIFLKDASAIRRDIG